MRRLAIALGLLAAGPMAAGEPDCVVLLHGIGLHRFMMKRLESRLRAEGYRVVNVSYPSRRVAFEVLADDFLPRQLRAHDVGRAPRLHFVTHSLGSLIVRRLIQRARPPNLGRVVMIGPPNHGSTAADAVAGSALLRGYLGPTLPRLGTRGDAIARALTAADFPLGIIAGRAALNPLFRRALKGPNDGAVTVESARLEGMQDFIVVPYSHTAMLWRGEVIRQAVEFLRTGAFRPPASRAAPAR